MKDNQSIYRDLCFSKKNIPLHLQPWWLDAVYDRQWNVLLWDTCPTRAAFPYCIRKKNGFKTIVPPPLSPVNGCWIDLEEGLSRYDAWRLENEILTSFAKGIDALRVDFFLHYFLPGITNWQPFHWQGFSQTTRYTYVLENLLDLTRIWNGFHKRVRHYIRSVEKKLTIEPATAEDIFLLSEPTYHRRDLQTPYTESYIRRLFTAARQHHTSRAIKAMDEKQQPVGIHWMVWDGEKAYGVILGHAAAAPQGTSLFLLWDQFRFASRQGLSCFDFQGSMMESVALFNRRMGAEPRPYFCMEKYYSQSYKFLRTLRHGVRK